MKVLYIGMYAYDTGWGHAAINDVMSLDAAGVEVVPRPLYFHKEMREMRTIQLPERFLELENNDDHNCDICIQQMLPEYMEYCGHFDKCIASIFYEASNFRRAGWTKYLNMMDDIWVPNSSLIQTCKDSRVTTPVHVVPQGFDTTKYMYEYKPYALPDIEDKFTFYTVGEFRCRKNLIGTLKASHLAFKPYEQVALVIKGGLTEASANQSNIYVKKIIEDVKKGMKLYPSSSCYLNEIIITQHLTEEEMMRIHSTCDCFVLPSYGEAAGIPAIEAMFMGKTPIVTNEGGPAEYIQDGVWLIPCRKQPLFGMVDQLDNLFSSDQDWSEPDIHALINIMREAYENKQERGRRAQIGRERMGLYSYESIGKTMKEILES